MHPSLRLRLIKLYLSETSQKLRVLALVDNNNKSNWHIMYSSRKGTNYCVCSLSIYMATLMCLHIIADHGYC